MELSSSAEPDEELLDQETVVEDEPLFRHLLVGEVGVFDLAEPGLVAVAEYAVEFLAGAVHSARDDQSRMMQGQTRAGMTQVALAGHVRPGDHIASGGSYVEVVRVRRAQGRKPRRGENLHLVGAVEVIKINSLDNIRIVARRA